ncbi:MAG: hypothetical protein JWO47_342 [Candidatus Saccharibacteria bacterium]|nr:hypothetical protein [Candidatus Saccharibacteria bacterium]
MEAYPEVADDEKEQLYADVRRHWLGRAIIILTGAILILLMLGFALFLPSLTRGIHVSFTSQLKVMVTLGFILMAGLIAVGTFITLWIYNQSRILITDQNVIEVRQLGLFSHKVGHLNMINVEDVSVTKKGILQTFFNYGTMTIETAGEEENFTFPNTPNPDFYRRTVINCHERAIERIGRLGSAQRVELAHGGF